MHDDAAPLAAQCVALVCIGDEDELECFVQLAAALCATTGGVTTGATTGPAPADCSAGTTTATTTTPAAAATERVVTVTLISHSCHRLNVTSRGVPGLSFRSLGSPPIPLSGLRFGYMLNEWFYSVHRALGMMWRCTCVVLGTSSSFLIPSICKYSLK
jgi:hypothetical protein